MSSKSSFRNHRFLKKGLGGRGDFWGFADRRMMVLGVVQTARSAVQDEYVGVRQRSASIYIYIF